jgi:hypothetical protein
MPLPRGQRFGHRWDGRRYLSRITLDRRLTDMLGGATRMHELGRIRALQFQQYPATGRLILSNTLVRGEPLERCIGAMHVSVGLALANAQSSAC